MRVTHEMNTEEQLVNTGKGFDIYRRAKGYYDVLSQLNFKEMGLIDQLTKKCLQAMADISSLWLKAYFLPLEEAASIRNLKKKPKAPGKETRRITNNHIWPSSSYVHYRKNPLEQDKIPTRTGSPRQK